MKMKKIKFENVSEFSIDDEFDIGVFDIGGVEYAFLGGEFWADGVRNFLRPLDNVKENLRTKKDWYSDSYERSRNDVVYYMDNRNMHKCNDVIKDIRYYESSKKW